jgi:hypothetical protein
MGDLIVRLTRKKYRYHGHRSILAEDYLGVDGPKIEVGFFVYVILYLFGYNTTRERIEF